jgi:selenocysteine lyase/cysteine desulfurase
MTSLAFSAARALSPWIRSGDEIVVTAQDHDANIAPWLALAHEKGALVHTVPLNKQTHSVDLDELERVLNPRTRLAALGWVSNITGTITDIGAAISRIRTTNALVFLDATQAVPHLPVDFAESGADFMAFSAYKLFGPHMGLLVGKSALLQEFSPPNIRYATPEAPRSWEVGTQNFEAQAAALGTFEYFDSLSGAFGLKPNEHGKLFQEIQLHERMLSQRLLRLLESLPLQILGITDPDQAMHRVPTFAVHAEQIDARALSDELISREFFVRNGHFHANHVLDAYGLAGTANGCLRAGLAHYNTLAEVDAFGDALTAILAPGGRR